MTWILTTLGIILVFVALHDVFQTLLHPSGRGRLSRLVFLIVWRMSRRMNHRAGSVVGPLGTVAVIGLWATLVTVGWALIYYPHIPGGFTYSPGVDASRYWDPAEALYVSLVTLATLGYGDVVAVDEWIRLVSPLQAVIGFALLTAAVSWFSQIYPALARRRRLATRLTLLRQCSYGDRMRELDPATASRVLDELGADIVQVRIDLTQNAETYFFRESNADLSLAASITYALDLCERARRSPSLDVRLSGEITEAALEDFGSVLRRQFRLREETLRQILDSFESDHGHARDKEAG